MTFTLPSFDDLKAEILGRWRAWIPDVSTAPGSDAYIKSETLAHVIHGLHLHLRYGVLRNLIPTQAGGIYLDAWLYLFGLSDGSGGFGRIKARGSSATDGITITATALASPDYDLQGTEFTDSQGQRYQIAESVMQSAVWGASGNQLSVDVAAIDKGASTNIDVSDGEVFQWVTTPDSMSTTITQAADFDGGADEETDAQARARLSAYLSAPPQGGNWANWKQWIEDASPGALAAYVWIARQYTSSGGHGWGTVDYCAFQTGESGSDRFISSGSDLWDAIEDALTENAPVRLARNARQLTITEVSQDVEIDVELSPSIANADMADWDAAAVKTTVSRYSSSTKTITAAVDVCSPTLSGGIEAGDRVIIDEEEVVVSSVNVGGDAKVFTIESWPGTWGSITGKHIMAGGGIIMTIVEAIRDYADSIGPARGDYAAPIPGWDDTLRITGIQSAVIQAGDGKVIDVTVSTPAADVAPSYDDASDVEAVTVDEIVVWEA